MVSVIEGFHCIMLPISLYIVDEQINQMAMKVGISPQELDKPCAEQHLIPISQQLVKWSLYASHLGLTRSDVEDIQTNVRHTSSQDHCLAMLQKWYITDFGEKATYRHLLKGCVKLQRDLLAVRNICEVIKNST